MGKRETVLRTGKKLLGLLPRRQRPRFVLIALLLGASAAFSQVTPLAVGYLTDRVLRAPDDAFLSALPALAAILAAAVIGEGIKVARRLLVEDAATQTEKNARQRAAASLLRAPLAYFRGHMTGNIQGRLNRGLEGATRLVKLTLMDLAPAVVTGLAAIVTIFVRLPAAVACLVILVIPVGILLVLRQIATQRGIRVELMEKKADLDGTMVELLGGIETIRALDGAQAEEERLLVRAERLRQKEMRHHRAMAGYDCLKFLNEAVFSVLTIGLSVLLASRGRISAGAVLTAYLCFTQLTGPLRELHRILDEYAECAVLAEDYFRLLELPVDFSYRDPAPAAQPAEGAAQGEIRVRDLRFAYPEKPERAVLKDLNFTIPAGTLVGIAGPSGCGKSSLIKVLDKLEPAQGTVRLGGEDLAALSRRELAERVALVPQTPFLVADTVFRNICYGARREVTQAEVEEAARRANIAQDIEGLPGRYQFQLSEGGRNLSGGQRQRIALARIFLRKPRVLILDEATAALDNTSERWVQREIERLKEETGMTVLAIAHRLSTLRDCDEILVMDHGEIVQRGTYAELERAPGLFREMAHGAPAEEG